MTHANQVWAMDITYVRMHKGWMYLCAVLDWCSRKVLAWRLSNAIDVQFFVDAAPTGLRMQYSIRIRAANLRAISSLGYSRVTAFGTGIKLRAKTAERVSSPS